MSTPYRSLDKPSHGGLLARLDSFRALGPNWNGYDGVPPRDGAVDQCLGFLVRLGPGIRVPTAMASGQGEVGLLWENGDLLVELGFTGDGHYGYLVAIPGQASHEAEGIPLDGDMPGVLADALGLMGQREDQ